MSKKEISSILATVNANAGELKELKPLILELSKKLDALCDGAGSKKPAGGSGRRPKTQAKNPEEKKFTNILTFFKTTYPQEPKKFDKLWDKGAKKKILEDSKDDWSSKKGADREKAKINILYKSLSESSRTKLRKMKVAALENYNKKNKESEDHAEEDDNSDSENEEEDNSASEEEADEEVGEEEEEE